LSASRAIAKTVAFGLGQHTWDTETIVVAATDFRWNPTVREKVVVSARNELDMFSLDTMK
jgi:hypothetical protein